MPKDLERRIYHIHPWEDKNSKFGRHKTIVERGTTVRVMNVWDNGSITRDITVPESGWKATVTGVYRDSYLMGMKSPDKTYSADLRGWRNLPLHPSSLLGVGWSGFSGYTRDYLRAENWFTWKGRNILARVTGRR